MRDGMQCVRCGQRVDTSGGRRIAFAETCDGCGTDLHSCVHCTHHDPAAYTECREPNAERVSDRERANRCEYFRPAEAGGPAGGPDAERDHARAALDALFRK